jgi:SAM-dependent methyltransferase
MTNYEEALKLQPWYYPYIIDGKPLITEYCSAQNLNKRKEIFRKFLEEIKSINKSCLDVGCNSGYFTMDASKYFGKTIGIDNVEVYIKQADFIKMTPEYYAPGCQFKHVLFDEIYRTYDIVMSLHLLLHQKDLIHYLNNLKRLSNEYILLETFTFDSSEAIIKIKREDWGIDIYPSMEGLKEYFKFVGLELIKYENQE